MTDLGHAQLDFSLRCVTVNILTICCQIPGMRKLAFSLHDVTINALSYVFTLHVLLLVRDFGQLKGEGPYFDCFHVS